MKTKEFATLVNEHKNLVFSVCYSFTRNYFDAEDLAQETFLAAYRGIKSFDGENFAAWITTIAANKCRDHLRRARPMGELDSKTLEDPSPSPEQALILSAEEDTLRRLCARLDDPYRKVALGYFCENRKLRELSQETGEKLKTLQTRLYRAKKRLRVLWKEEMG